MSQQLPGGDRRCRIAWVADFKINVVINVSIKIQLFETFVNQIDNLVPINLLKRFSSF